MAIQATTILLAAKNPARSLVFFPGGVSAADDSVICFNYKTAQWTSVSAYDGIGLYSVNEKTEDIGLVRFSSGSVDLQDQFTTYPEQTGTIETGATDLNKGGRALVDAVRPLVNGGSTAVRIGVQDTVSGSVTYSTGTSVNSRSGQAHFRAADNPVEGRYHRLELVITGTWSTAMGADVDFTPSGRV